MLGAICDAELADRGATLFGIDSLPESLDQPAAAFSHKH